MENNGSNKDGRSVDRVLAEALAVFVADMRHPELLEVGVKKLERALGEWRVKSLEGENDVDI